MKVCMADPGADALEAAGRSRSAARRDDVRVAVDVGDLDDVVRLKTRLTRRSARSRFS